jgi:DNA helicase-2/ATP-dependent DNA helicase PcrA
MEEERRLCYVGMTRAEKRLYLTWARFRRRFGGGQPERCLPSRFLNEVPGSLCEKLSPHRGVQTEEVDLFSEQYDVRESVKKNLYTGRTYNSVDNIAQFFAERGMPPPSGLTRPAQNARPPASPLAGSAPPVNAKPATAAPVNTRPPMANTSPAITPGASAAGRPQAAPRPPAAAKKLPGFRSGTVVRHPKYGRGTVLRREGDGEDAKLTISFPGYGLKKIVEKYAGIKVEE